MPPPCPAAPLWLAFHPPTLKGLEGELRAELNVARVVALRGDEAEGRVGRGRRAGVEADPVAEVRVVEGVDGLGPDLQTPLLAHLEVLREREVRNRVGLVAQVVQGRRDVAQAERVERDEPRPVRVDVVNGRRVNAVLPALAVALAEACHEVAKNGA